MTLKLQTSFFVICYMTRQQPAFFGGPMTSPVPPEKRCTSYEAGPESEFPVWLSLFLLLPLPVSRLLLFLEDLSDLFLGLSFPRDCSWGCPVFWGWWTALYIDKKNWLFLSRNKKKNTQLTLRVTFAFSSQIVSANCSVAVDYSGL